MDLRYESRESGFLNHYRIRSLMYPKSWMDWNIFMPHSRITGTLRLKEENEDIAIDGVGYHDGNRGKWVPYMPLWNVLLYQSHRYDDKFSMAAALFYNNRQGGDMYIQLGDRTIHFERARFRVRHLEWRKDRRAGVRIPVLTELGADNGDITVRARARYVDAEALVMDMPFVLPSLVISEQLSTFDITVKEHGETVYANKGGMGFSEFTARKWL